MGNVFLHGFKVALRQWRLAAIAYGIQLCLVLTLGMQVFAVLEASIGHSLEVRKLMNGYDHTVLIDFLKVHGASITPLIGQLRWLLLVWLLFSVFIDAGLLYGVAATAEKSGRVFWQGAPAYFFPFLKICLIFLLLALLWTAAVLTPIAVYLEPALEHFPSEKYTVWTVLFLLAFWVFGLLGLFLWSVISRLTLLKTGASIGSSLRRGGQIFRKNKGRFLGLLLGFVGLQIALVAAYWTLEGAGGMTSPALILVFFLVQQAFVFLRVLLRQVVYAGACFLGFP